MNCEQIHTLLIEYLDGNLDDQKHKEVAKHLENCSTCTDEIQELKMIFEKIDNEPPQLPDASLRSNFEQMLEKEKELLQDSKVVSLSKHSKNSRKSILQMAATIALIVSAYFFGKNQNTDAFTKEIAVLEKEKIEMKQTMTISLIENESASKRLQAVNYAEELEKPGNKILKALINKMYYDDHINVRLAAAEALVKFSDSEMVRNALIHALEIEKDPGMQIELIQILVSIQEKRAVPSMERLLQGKETPDYVKDQVKVGLPNLI